MDVILNSLASSSLNSVLKSTATESSPFVYRYAQNTDGTSLSGVSRTFTEIQPQNTVQFGSAVDFIIPKQGLLKNMFIKMKLTNSTGGAVNVGHSAPVSQIERIQLITSGRILAETSSEGLLCLMSAQPYNSRSCLAKMSNILGATGNVALADGATRKSYVPCLFSQCGNGGLEQLYDTNFVSPLTLRVFVASAGAYAASALSSISLSLFCEFIRESASMSQSRVQQDYGEGALQRIQTNQQHEFVTKTLAANDRVMELEVKSNNYIKTIFIYAEDTTDQSTKDKGVVLNAVKLESNGQVIADFGSSEDGELLLHISNMDPDKAHFASGNGYNTDTDALANRYRYNFGLSNDPRKVYGATAGREMSNFKISVEVAGATDTAHKLHAVIEYAMIESIESASGKVTTSISS